MNRIGTGNVILAWILILGLLTWGFSALLDYQRNPNRALTTRTDGGVKEVVLERNRDGHYVADGAINGHPVTLLVDTGATTVTVPGALAARLGLARGAPLRAQTANGAATVYATTLDSVALGGIVLHDVRANISPGMSGEEALLGMSFLRGLELIQRDGTLRIRQ